jgi:hypothetical protein
VSSLDDHRRPNVEVGVDRARGKVPVSALGAPGTANLLYALVWGQNKWEFDRVVPLGDPLMKDQMRSRLFSGAENMPSYVSASMCSARAGTPGEAIVRVALFAPGSDREAFVGGGGETTPGVRNLLRSWRRRRL